MSQTNPVGGTATPKQNAAAGEEGAHEEPTVTLTGEGEGEGEGGQPTPSTPPQPVYTQADLNRAAKAAREEERRKHETAEREKQGEFQALYQAELERAQKLQTSILVRDVCDELDIPRDWRDSVTGTDEESIRTSAEALKEKLNKLVEEATANIKTTPKTPGTPPPSPDEGADMSDAEKQKKTRDLVYQAMGLGKVK